MPKGPPFTFLGTVTLFKNLISKFFAEFFKNLPKVPLHFFHILQPTGVSQIPKDPPFTILSLRYSTDFGSFRLVKLQSITTLPSMTCIGHERRGNGDKPIKLEQLL